MKNISMIMMLTGFLVLLVALTGCATGGGSSGSSPSRGKLTEATKESAGEEEESDREDGRTRTKDETYTSDFIDEGDDDDGGGSWFSGLTWGLFSGGGGDNGSAAVDDGEGMEPDFKRVNLNFWYSRSEIAGDVIRNFDTFTLMLSGFTEKIYRGHIGLYYGRGKLGNQQYVQEGLRWIGEFGLEGGHRFYLTPDHSFMGFYLLMGLRVGILNWSYTEAIEAPTADGGVEMISHDALLLVTPYLGFGTSLVQTKAVHFGASLTLGARFSQNQTFEKFDNDLFKDVGEVKLNLEASVFF